MTAHDPTYNWSDSFPPDPGGLLQLFRRPRLLPCRAYITNGGPTDENTSFPEHSGSTTRSAPSRLKTSTPATATSMASPSPRRSGVRSGPAAISAPGRTPLVAGEASPNVWYGSVTCYDAACFNRFTQIYEIYPQVGGMDPRPLSEVSCHTLVTDIIEVADDGQTARAYFLTPGLIYSTLNANQKKRCAYLWERYGADFVFEDGQWLFLHEQVCPDIFGTLDDGNWAHSKYEMLKNPPPPPPPALCPPRRISGSRIRVLCTRTGRPFSRCRTRCPGPCPM